MGIRQYCVLSGTRDLDEQLNEWYFGESQPSYGRAVYLRADGVEIVDYYKADTIIPVVSIEDTDEDVLLAWTDLKNDTEVK